MTFDEWFLSKQGEPYDSMYVFARDAWIASQGVEREACAKVCEKEAVQIVIDGPEERAYNNAVSDCVSAIRARGTNGQ